MAGDHRRAWAAGGGAFDGLAMSGRPQPDASIDDVPISAGRWWTGPGEVVLGRETAEMFGLQVGQTVALYAAASGPAAPGEPAAR